jgi:hypothetical protein
MKLARVDTVALARRSHMFGDRMVRDVMKRSGLVLTGEDRDMVIRLCESAFSMGYLAAAEDYENEYTARVGASVVKTLDRTRKKKP